MTFDNAALRHSLSLIIFLKWIDYSTGGRQEPPETEGFRNPRTEGFWNCPANDSERIEAAGTAWVRDVIYILAIISHGISFEKPSLATWGLEPALQIIVNCLAIH